MQPGGPQGAGRLDGGVPVVTLPGNPVSSHVSFEVFVRPALRAALGHPHQIVDRDHEHFKTWTSRLRGRG